MSHKKDVSLVCVSVRDVSFAASQQPLTVCVHNNLTCIQRTSHSLQELVSTHDSSVRIAHMSPLPSRHNNTMQPYDLLGLNFDTITIFKTQSPWPSGFKLSITLSVIIHTI